MVRRWKYRIFSRIGCWVISGLAFWAGIVPAASPTNFDCVIAPYAVVDASSAVPGVLQEIYVERGDWVQPGQLLAQLESGVENASLEVAKARAVMDNEIRLQQVSLRYDRENRKRLETLSTQKVVSIQDKDKAKRDADLSRWKLRQAHDLQRLRELERVKAEEVLKRRSVFSPIEGVVVKRYRSPGEYLEDQPVLRIAQLDPLHVEVILPMEFFGKVSKGMEAEVFPETSPNQPRVAQVTVVDGMGDAASGTFGVRLELANPEHEIPAGLKCNVRFRSDALRQSAGVAQTQTKELGHSVGMTLPKARY